MMKARTTFANLGILVCAIGTGWLVLHHDSSPAEKKLTAPNPGETAHHETSPFHTGGDQQPTTPSATDGENLIEKAVEPTKVDRQREAFVGALTDPRYLKGEAIPDELEQKFLAAFSQATTVADRVKLYSIAPPVLLRKVRDSLIADHQVAMDSGRGGYLRDILRNLQRIAKDDTVLGDIFLHDIRRILEAMDSETHSLSTFNSTDLYQVAAALSSVGDLNQMNLLATLIVNAPPETQAGLLGGMSASPHKEDFAFIIEYADRIPKALDCASSMVFNIRRRRIALRFIEIGAQAGPVGNGDWIPQSEEDRASLASEMAAQEAEMIDALEQRGVNVTKKLPPMF